MNNARPIGHNHQLTVRYVATASLKAHAGHARTHSKKQIKQIAESIRQFGFCSAIGIDETGHILCGHGRWQAAKHIGLTEVPVVSLSGMTDHEKRAFILADNRIAESAGWDKELLAVELGLLLEADLDFSIDITGFEMAEIDTLIGTDTPTEDDADAHAIVDPTAPIVSRLGDLWEIGPHRLLCGDARDPASYDRLLGGRQVEFVLTDPPYNVPIAGHVSGLGTNVHREFAMASGEMTQTEFTAFLTTVMKAMVLVSRPGAIHMLFMDWRHMREMLDAGTDAYSVLKNLVVWAKTNAGMGSFYRSQHELLFVFKVDTAPHINNFGLGEYGRYRTNVWTYAGANSFGGDRAEDLAVHPTCKPVAMLVEAILDCSNRSGAVLDAFAGSGSTLVAAHKAGRHGYGIEIDPAYADVIVKRLQKETGIVARLGGASFDTVAAQRIGAKREAA